MQFNIWYFITMKLLLFRKGFVELKEFPNKRRRHVDYQYVLSENVLKGSIGYAGIQQGTSLVVVVGEW